MSIPFPIALRDEKQRKRVIRPPAGGGRGGIRRRRGRRGRTFARRDQVVALIPAVGSAAALEGEPKLFLRLGSKTLIEHVVERLLRCVGTVVVGVPPSEVEKARELLGERAEVYAAGPGYTRALEQLLERATAPFVLIHDVSWPFASPVLFRNVITAAAECGAACAVDYTGSPIGRVENEKVTILADDAVVAQSPSAFHRELLQAGLRGALACDAHVDNVWTVLCRSDVSISPVQNEKWNIRINAPADWAFARRVIWPALRRRLARRKAAVAENKAQE